MFGGEGDNELVAAGTAADYRIDYVLAGAGAQACAGGPATAVKLTHIATGAVDCAWDVARVVFTTDVANYLLTGTGAGSHVATGGIVIGSQNQSFTTLGAALAGAAEGAVISLTAPADFSAEGLILVERNHVTVQGPAGSAVTGFVLAEGVTHFQLGGEITARVIGNDGPNRIQGNAAANVLEGRGGDDVIIGGGGSDRLSGGNGGDLIVADGRGAILGGAGDDRIVIAGTDARVLGGSGRDLFIVDGVDPGAGLQLQSVIADFVPGTDRVDLAALRKQGAPLVLADLLAGGVSTETALPLNGLTLAGGLSGGSLTLYLLDERDPATEDFVFLEPSSAWRTDAGLAP
jgi:Ca2+-binding RTX toxin-like protein